jgi:hypothetical protein
VVSRIFASWNRLDEWLRQIEGLRFVASPGRWQFAGNSQDLPA